MIKVALYLLMPFFTTVFYSFFIGFDFGVSRFLRYHYLSETFMFLYLTVLFVLICWLLTKVKSGYSDRLLFTHLGMYFSLLFVVFKFSQDTYFPDFVNFNISFYLFYLLGAIVICLIFVTKKTDSQVSGSHQALIVKILSSLVISVIYYVIKSRVLFVSQFLTGWTNSVSQFFLILTCVILPSYWLFNLAWKKTDHYQ